LDYGDLGDISVEVDSQRNGEVSTLPSIVSADYQKSKYLNARAGKIGIGSFSMDSMFASIIQGTNLRVNPAKFTSFTLGKSLSNLNITSIYTNKTINKLREIHSEYYSNKASFEVWLETFELDDLVKAKQIKLSEVKFKTEVIAAYQSASVDDEKQQILSKLNIQSETFDVIRGLIFLGYEEDEIHALTSQNFMFDLVSRIREKSSSIEEYSRDVHEKALEEIISEKLDQAGISLSFEEFVKSDCSRLEYEFLREVSSMFKLLFSFSFSRIALSSSFLV
jgi:hypothetical protein